ncbi:MAG: radical SAM protein [Candidatus Omnitrophica bacterium]|nr:radical SAM protein [Candidatus Omnitrophota bacterium]
MSIGFLEANLPKDKFNTYVFDFSLEKVNPYTERKRLKTFFADLDINVFGISSALSFNYPYARKTAEIIKELIPRAKIVLGGCHASMTACKILGENDNIDFILKGEAEFSFPALLDYFKSNLSEDALSLVPGLVYRRNNSIMENPAVITQDLDSIKPVNYRKMRLEDYVKAGYRYGTNNFGLSAPLWISRGCPYGCTFCSASIMNGRKVRYHSIEYVIKLIKHLYEKENVRTFTIIDDNFTFDRAYVKKFCFEVKKLGFKDINIVAPNGVRIDRLDQETLKLMYEAGWRVLMVAIETDNEKIMQKMDKKIDLKEVPGKIAMIKRAGFKVHSNFILGFPGASRGDIKKTIDYACRLELDMVGFPKFQPLPGTKMFDELCSNGEIDEDFLPVEYNEKSKYAPKGIKTQMLDKLQRNAYLLFYLRHPASILLLFENYSIKHLLGYIRRVIIGKS